MLQQSESTVTNVKKKAAFMPFEVFMLVLVNLFFVLALNLPLALWLLYEVSGGLCAHWVPKFLKISSIPIRPLLPPVDSAHKAGRVGAAWGTALGVVGAGHKLVNFFREMSPWKYLLMEYVPAVIFMAILGGCVGYLIGAAWAKVSIYSPGPGSGVHSADEATYEAAIVELEGPTRRAGVWAKAMAESNGDESKAKAWYIRYRVKQISAGEK